MLKIYSIGFTEKTAEKFFRLVSQSGVRTLIDVRLNNTSQLSGFAKKNDLKFFLKELCDVEYLHLPDMAPTKEMLKSYQKKEIEWKEYADQYLSLLARRNIEKYIDREELNNSCLLCSENLPHYCHRRLVIEYLRDNARGVDIIERHLV